MNTIKENLIRVHERISNAAHRAGRDPEEIKLVAVSKKVPLEKIKDAEKCNQLIFGENYIQEAQNKIPHLDKNLSWHFIGHLQSNKTKQAAELFHVIETIDRLKPAVMLDKHLATLHKTMTILIQVNIGREPQKSGILPEDAENLLRQINNLHYLKVAGLMAMPPIFDDPEMSRPYFAKLRNMMEDFQTKKLLGQDCRPELSMGMSHDFEVAVEEGATFIRLGTAIFGPRS